MTTKKTRVYMDTLPLFIAGKRQDASSQKTFANIYPATGDVLNRVQAASSEDVEEAIESCKEAQEKWAAITPRERGRIMHKAVALLRERNEELARIEVLDTGKPIQEARTEDVHSGADALEYYAGVASTLHGDYYDLGGSFAYTRREPLGVCAGIGAWNYPIQIACWKAAPALACGNAMIFKPSEFTPTSALKVAEIFKEAGVPAGVFNVVQGDGDVGEMLTSHPGIAKVSLTGEVPTGRKIMANSADTLKQVTLEMGGKSPLIIFDDADLDEAVEGAMMANFFTQGEICTNGTRVFVHKDIKQEFMDKLVERTKKLTIGDPLNSQTEVGALISKEQYDKVMSYLALGPQEEAEILLGGRSHQFEDDTPLNNGYYVQPTIFDRCTDDMRIVQEEIFGPVMAVLDFEEEQEVIGRANDTPYGLAAGVFTNALQRAHRVINQLQAGICWINNYNVNPVEIPIGGYKQSGIGRENGLVTIEHYSQLKTVYVEMDKVDAPFTK